jgi:hypothetical protein
VVNNAYYPYSPRICCIESPNACQSPSDCCSGNCMNQQCVCIGNGQQCNNSGSCCDGGICAISDAGQYNYYSTCCQANGSPCHFGDECCTGDCHQGSCR